MVSLQCNSELLVSFLHTLTFCVLERVGCPPSQVEQKEQRAITNISNLLHIAADRLESIAWFGILEDLDRSMELLQHTFQLQERPTLPQSNQGKRFHVPPTPEQIQALETLMPQDLWLYRYACLLYTSPSPRDS